MSVQLDDADIAILKSLMADGCKSFRAISRERVMSTPTVKAIYERLRNMGLIKSVKREIGLSKVDRRDSGEFDALQDLKKQKTHFHLHVEGLKFKLKCEFCGGLMHDKLKVLKFDSFERCFCCAQCRASYKEKHGGRIICSRSNTGKSASRDSNGRSLCRQIQT